MTEKQIRVLFRFWVKFHYETHCGNGGVHWAECQGIQRMLKAAGLAEDVEQVVQMVPAILHRTTRSH